MGRKVTLNLDADTEKKLTALAGELGYTREMAAIYAVRLISACMREGLLDGGYARAWPDEAQRLTGGARVLEMPRKKAGGARSHLRTT
ncbi:MAG: hypothetical protein E7321_06935 [Clostridiales bacterium]|nr:hypothetical protein [Clostridiales bacterium]